MRIHSNILTAAHVQAAVRLVPGAYAEVTTHGSRSADHSLEVKLSGEGRGKGRRHGNSGQYGSMTDGDAYALMWDEWGIILSALYTVDPHAVCGTAKRPIYAGQAGFDHQTAYRFDDVVTWVPPLTATSGAGVFTLTDDGRAIVAAPHAHRWEWTGTGSDLTCKGTPSKGITCTAGLNHN